MDVKQKLLRGGLSLVDLFSRILSTFYKIPLCECDLKIVMRAMAAPDFRDIIRRVLKAGLTLGDLYILDSDS